MEFYPEILAAILSHEEANIVFPQLKLNAEQLIEKACYKALSQIKSLLEDEQLDDPSCVIKIEEILRIFEKLEIRCGNRHDFG